MGIRLLYIKKEFHLLEDIYIKMKTFINVKDENIVIKNQKRNSGYLGDYYLIEFFGFSVSLVYNLWSNDENETPFDIVENYEYVLEIRDLIEDNNECINAISNRFRDLLIKHGYDVYVPNPLQ